LEELIMVHKERQISLKSLGRWPITLAIALALATGAISTYSLLRFRTTAQSPQPEVPEQSTPAITAVTGLGRLEPEGEVIQLSAPTSLEGARVARLAVREGDSVRAGDVVAVLDSFEARQAALRQAEQQVEVARARLERVKAGAQTGEIAAQEAAIARLDSQLRGDIAAQQATLDRLQAELRNAEREFQRNQQLYDEGAISASDLDSKRLSVETIQAQVNEAKASLNRTVETLQKQISEAEATLDRIAEVRPVDVQVAQAEVNDALAAVERAQADLNLSYVRAPIDGQILEIYTQPGEIVSSQGIAALARTEQMYAIAEIYDTDIAKVRVGQPATITSEAFSGAIEGTVAQIGLQVGQQDIFSVNPLADTDRKVIEVKIRIDDPEARERIANLTNLQVQVAIHI
jgi:HlyD family secretion protein